MDEFLKLSTNKRKDIFEQSQSHLGLTPASIEKDFWVCWVLRELFAFPEWGNNLTFKGGTSLSKAWRLINRFSEDIDIVIERDFLGFGKDLSKKKQKKLKEVCSERISNDLQPKLKAHFQMILPVDFNWQLTIASKEDDPDQQTLLFHYPSVFAVTREYMRPIVKMEFGARGETEPLEVVSINAYVSDAFPSIVQKSIFTIPCVSARRTFWEKVMLLHEETYRPTDKVRRPRLARHYYDLYCLIQKGIATEAVSDEGLFERIATHREKYFGYSWMDYTTLKKGSLRLIPLPQQEVGWRQDYAAMSDMFIDEPPSYEEIMKTVKKFEDQFNQ